MNAIDEFRFPCFVDICTFPHQYCNSDPDERRCNYCTVSICTSDFIPDPCKYYCKSLKSTTSMTTTPSVSSAALALSSNCSQVTPDIPIYIWIFIFLMVVAVVALSVAIVVILRSRRQKSKLLQDARTEQGENQENKPLMKNTVEADSVSEYSEFPKEPNSLSSNSSSGPISQPEDSVHGKDAASSGPPPYSKESKKKSKETLQEYQKCTEPKTLRPIQRQSSRTPSPESESVSNPTLAMSGELLNTSLFVSSSEGHIPERNHCCRELESTKSDK